jgi:integrase
VQGLLGEALIKSLKPTEKPYEVRDTRLKGLLLRVQPSGAMTFYVEFARGKRVSLGRAEVITPTEARNEAKSILGHAYHGRDPAAAKRQARLHTLESFIDDEYGPWAQANIRTHKATLRRLRRTFADFADYKLVEITPLVVERWRSDRLKAGKKPSTVNRDLDDIKSTLGKAVQWGFLERHPIEKVRRTRVDDRATVRFLTNEEQIALFKALDQREERLRAGRDSANQWRKERDYALLPDLRAVSFADHLKPMVTISLHTGVRYGELAKLAWDDVDLDKAILTIHGYKAKSTRTRHIPLNAVALQTLSDWEKQKRDGVDLVFPNQDGKPFDNVRTSWESVLTSAGITKFRWHDMRHSFASHLVMLGADLNTVRELLGHSDYQMTCRYAHLAPEHKAAAVNRLVPIETGAPQ